MSKPIAITSENAAELLQPVFDAAKQDFLEGAKGLLEGMEARVLEKASKQFAPKKEDQEQEDSTSSEEADPNVPSVEDRLASIENTLKELNKASRKSNQPEGARHTPAPQSEDEGFDPDAFVAALSEKKQETN